MTAESIGSSYLTTTDALFDNMYGIHRETGSFTFTTAGATGSSGPTLKECIAHYNVDWVDLLNMFDVTKQRIQEVIIQTSGDYHIKAYGAARLGHLAYGAITEGEVRLEKGCRLFIIIGQIGLGLTSGNGGTFVLKQETKELRYLFVAGGAGGPGRSSKQGEQLEQTANTMIPENKNYTIPNLSALHADMTDPGRGRLTRENMNKGASTSADYGGFGGGNKYGGGGGHPCGMWRSGNPTGGESYNIDINGKNTFHDYQGDGKCTIKLLKIIPT